MIQLKHIACWLSALLIGGQLVQAQVPVQINSGDPAFPFPQFMDYGSERSTLASHNPVGVTHAEMEQQIRDAWQIYANSFSYTTDEYGGVKYIKGNIGCPYDCSEGDGYALLAAAYMADKTTFDGLWMRVHDLKMVKYPRYKDCVVPNAGYKYGQNAIADQQDAVADGSFDIALALLMAWKQWGTNMGINDFCGNPISYKTEAIRVINGLVEVTNSMNISGNCGRVSGSVGFDGYFKNGNTWNELTDWANTATPECPEFKGPTKNYFDYAAPAYFHAFANVLQQENQPQWNISQFKRAEASSDWLMGKLFESSPSALPLAGQVSLTGTTPVFNNFSMGEDFRNPWRTILNYVWHGNALTSWDPILHQVTNVPNTYEKDMALRFATFLKDPTAAPWSNNCDNSAGAPPVEFKGVATLKGHYTTNGKELSSFTLNWLQGTASPAAVASQDFDLMAKMFRQCVLEWDVTKAGDNYLTSTPKYFDGWFRLLGMLVLSGNAHSPLNMAPSANLKAYLKVNKTVANPGDTIQYSIRFRNLGSVSATGVVLKLSIPSGLQMLRAFGNGAVVGDSVVWKLSDVPGATTRNYGLWDSVYVACKVTGTQESALCAKAHISCANGSGWFSNEYPNNITAVMERNCVDVVLPAIRFVKKTDKKSYAPGDEARFVVQFENRGQSNWLNGGRPGVTLSFATEVAGSPGAASLMSLKARLFHDADEAYIDHGNYRFSFFMNDPVYKCLSGASGCVNGWELMNTISEGGNPTEKKLFIEPLAAGTNANGSWNQRLVVQFSNQKSATTAQLSRYYGLPHRVHEGGQMPLRVVSGLHTNQFSTVSWTDDFSWDAGLKDEDNGLYYPASDDFTNGNAQPVTSWIRNGCNAAIRTSGKIVVEEWDGYTWRRVAGNGPVPAKPVSNVLMTDTLPAGFTFKSFVRQNALGVNASATVISGGRTVISWSAPDLALMAKDSLVYIATVQGNCPFPDKKISTWAWLKIGNAPPIQATDTVTIQCGDITGLEEQAEELLKIYPNPARTSVYVKGHASVMLTIKDAKGYVVKNNVLMTENGLDVTDLANGAYFAEYKESDKIRREKLLIVR